MSTVAPHLSWGASYLVNDFYKRFVRRDASQAHYVAVSRAATVLLFLGSIAVTSQLASVEKAWELLLALGAGTGLVLILRWYWWRINAWSEISAMVASFAVSLLGFRYLKPRFAENDPNPLATIMLVTVACTTRAWPGVPGAHWVSASGTSGISGRLRPLEPQIGAATDDLEGKQLRREVPHGQVAINLEGEDDPQHHRPDEHLESMQRDACRVGENVLQEVAGGRVHPEYCFVPLQLLADLVEPRQDLVPLDLRLGLDLDKIVCGNRRDSGRGQAGRGIGPFLVQRSLLG